MKPLLLPLQFGLFDDQIGLSGLVALLVVNHPVKVAARELVELFLNGSDAFGKLALGRLERLSVLRRLRFYEGAEMVRLLGRDADGPQFLKALVGEMLFLQVGLGAVACLARAAVVAVKAAMALGPLGAHHRAAGAFEEAAERELVAVPHLARLALRFESFLNPVKEVGRDKRLVLALIRLAFPFHDADINTVGQELPYGELRPGLAGSGLHPEFKQPFGRGDKAMLSLRILLKNRLDDL